MPTLFAKWNSFIAEYPQWLMRSTTLLIWQKPRSKASSVLIFGSYKCSDQFQSLDDVESLFWVRQLISQLSYNFRGRVADGALSHLMAE